MVAIETPADAACAGSVVTDPGPAPSDATFDATASVATGSCTVELTCSRTGASPDGVDTLEIVIDPPSGPGDVPLATLGWEDPGCENETFGLATGNIAGGTPNCDHTAFGVTEGIENFYARADSAGVDFQGVVAAPRIGHTTLSCDFMPPDAGPSSANYLVRLIDGSTLGRPEFAIRETSGNPSVRMRCDSLIGGWSTLDVDTQYRFHMGVDYSTDTCTLEVYDESGTQLVDDSGTISDGTATQMDGVYFRNEVDGALAIDNCKLWDGPQPASDNAPVVNPDPPPVVACTDGVDCLCDRVTDSGHADYMPNLLACEDFEAATLTQATGYGGGPPNYGPWDDSNTNSPGWNSYWNNVYGATSKCRFQSGQSNTTETCGFAACGVLEWSAGDAWGANTDGAGNAGPCIDIVRDGEFDDEVTDLTLNETFGNGTQTFGFRIPVGQPGTENATSGKLGDLSWSPVTEVGITMGLAYADNLDDSGIRTEPWKHDQWCGGGTNCASTNSEMWHLGNTGYGGESSSYIVDEHPEWFPYQGFRFTTGESACSTALAGATVSVGNAACSGGGFGIGPDPAVYDQPTDFPFGTWACHRAHMKGMGTANLEMHIWHNETLVFSMTGFDDSGGVFDNSAFEEMEWNAYANHNQPGGGMSSEVTYRYEDEVIVNNGPPATCAQIGFPNPPPTASCTDGVDCLCDTLAADNDVVFCEDYENPGYNDGGATWTIEYSRAAVTQCWENENPCGGTPGPNCRILEGTSPNACFNMVQEGQCDVPGETDCVFDGNQSLGAKMDQGITHGIFGNKYFDRGVRNFGITSVVKLSENYVRSGPGFKYHEWGTGKQSLHMGQESCSGGSDDLSSEQTGVKGDACGDRGIWDSKLFYTGTVPSQSWTANLGSVWRVGTQSFFRPFQSRFEGGSMDWPLGTWACVRTKWTGYGTSSARVEQWFQGPSDSNESKVIDISNIDTLNLKDENGDPLDVQIANDYYNGPQCSGQDCGYGTTGCPCANMPSASERAYRYEDNIVVREGSPLTCAQIGFPNPP